MQQRVWERIPHLFVAIILLLGTTLTGAQQVGASTIPTTTNPTGNGNPGVRIIANPSF